MSQTKLKFSDLNSEVYKYIFEARANGDTLEDICEHFGISRATLNRWRKKNPELDSTILSSNTYTARHMVQLSVDALLKKLQPREVVTETVVDEWTDETGTVVKSHTSKKTKRIEADSNLIQFVLTRLSAEQWDKLAVQRLNQGVDESDEASAQLIDKLLNGYKNGEAKQ